MRDGNSMKSSAGISMPANPATMTGQ